MAATVRMLMRERVARSMRTTVPPGKVWVLTSAHVYNPMSTPATITLSADDLPIAGAKVPPQGTYVLDTRQVLLAGQGLGVRTDVDGIIFSASGVQDGAVQAQVQDVLVGTVDDVSASHATIDDLRSN